MKSNEENMRHRCRIVVSSENSQYLAWQTQLFCFSSMTRQGQRPLVIVHSDSDELRPEFHLLRAGGFDVVPAESFRKHPSGEYPPRNELGTLLTLSKIPNLNADCILFCEPDMLFVKRLEYDGVLSGDYYSYMQYGAGRIQKVINRAGLSVSSEELNRSSKIGVPYVIPTKDLRRIAEQWIHVLDSFESVEWIDIMYAYGIALAIEGLEPRISHNVWQNYHHWRWASRPVIHYCYGNATWNKRSFIECSPFDGPAPAPVSRLWRRTIFGEIMTQLAEARSYFAGLKREYRPYHASLTAS